MKSVLWYGYFYYNVPKPDGNEVKQLRSFIHKTVRDLIKKYKTSDPFELADAIGVKVRFKDLGNSKGFYRYEELNRYIVINVHLPQKMQKLVCAHELGHDRLHINLAKAVAYFHDNSLIDNLGSKPEYEANLFASELLLNDSDIEDCLEFDYSFDCIASALCTSQYLLAFKLQSMNARGYDFNIPTNIQSRFLKY